MKRGPGRRTDVVLVLSGPSDQRRLDLSREERRIRGFLGTSFHSTPSVVRLSTPDRLREAIKRRRPAVIHFSGHGEFDPETGMGRLILQYEDGRGCPVDSEDFARIVTGVSDTRLVVLNACRGAAFSRSTAFDPFLGSAAALVGAGVPAVVAMPRVISDSAAISFSSHFYQAIGRGESIEEAMIEGRLAISRSEGETCHYHHDRFGAGEWLLPTLFLGRRAAIQGTETVPPAFREGIRCLETKQYRRAFEVFRSFWKEHPESEQADLFQCLALMAAKPVRDLSPHAAKELDARLGDLSRSAGKHFSSFATVLRCILRVAYFETHRRRCLGPPTEQLVRKLPSLHITPVQVQYLAHVQISHRIRLRLNLPILDEDLF